VLPFRQSTIPFFVFFSELIDHKRIGIFSLLFHADERKNHMANMNLIDSIKAKSKSLNKHIVLPDATDERAIRAARICMDEKLARVSLVGDAAAITAKAASIGVSLDGVPVVDPSTAATFDAYATRS
jgi:hypothetical protein